MKKFTKFVFIFLAAGTVAQLSSCGGGNEGGTEDIIPAAPTNLNATDITETSAVLTWEGTAKDYEVIIGDADAVPVTGTHHTAIGLVAATEYTWQVRAKSGGLYSEWVDGPAFKTDKAPVEFGVPTNLNVSDITDISAKFTWDGDATYYEIEVGDTKRSISDKSFVTSELNELTEYNWRVRETNGNGSASGEWVTGEPFTTGKLGDYGDTFRFTAGYFLTFEYGTGPLMHYYLRLMDTGWPNDGYQFNMHFFAPAANYFIIPNGTYTPGGQAAWEMDTISSGLQRFINGQVVSYDLQESGTVEVTCNDIMTSNYTVVIDIVTEGGVAVKNTFTGMLTSTPGEE